MNIEWFALGFSIFALVASIAACQFVKYIERVEQAILRNTEEREEARHDE